jgi:hypothetical protein
LKSHWFLTSVLVPSSSLPNSDLEL